MNAQELLERRLDGAQRLAFVAATTTIDSSMEVFGRFDYSVAFLDASLVDSDGQMGAPPSCIGFANEWLTLAMQGLERELSTPDTASQLMLESWAIQIRVLLARH